MTPAAFAEQSQAPEDVGLGLDLAKFDRGLLGSHSSGEGLLPNCLCPLRLLLTSSGVTSFARDEPHT